MDAPSNLTVCRDPPRVAPPASRAREAVWHQRVGAFSGTPALIRQLGGDPQALFREAGLAGDALDDAEARVPYDALCTLFSAAARTTGCTHFGLLLGRSWRLADLGVVGELCANSPTVGDALRDLVDHQHLNSGSGLAFVLRHGSVVDLGYAIYHGGVAGADQLYDVAMACALNLLRELCGEDFVPSQVLLAHALNADLRQYRSVFRVAPRFNSEFTAIRFPQSWLAQPVSGADLERYRTAVARVEGKPSTSFLQQMHRATRALLLEGRCNGDDVATQLHLHRRTLNRRLNEHQTTFQHILDQLRFEVACQLLAGSRLSLDNVAATLGYASVTPFMRAFRRWSGTTPGRWRRQADASERVDD